MSHRLIQPNGKEPSETVGLHACLHRASQTEVEFVRGGRLDHAQCRLGQINREMV